MKDWYGLCKQRMAHEPSVVCEMCQGLAAGVSAAAAKQDQNPDNALAAASVVSAEEITKTVSAAASTVVVTAVISAAAEKQDQNPNPASASTSVIA